MFQTKLFVNSLDVKLRIVKRRSVTSNRQAEVNPRLSVRTSKASDWLTGNKESLLLAECDISQKCHVQ